jgi:hypothetical protein
MEIKCSRRELMKRPSSENPSASDGRTELPIEFRFRCIVKESRFDVEIDRGLKGRKDEGSVRTEEKRLDFRKKRINCDSTRVGRRGLGFGLFRT